MEYTSTGRAIKKDRSAYHRRQSARNGFPGLRFMSKLAVQYIQLADSGLRHFVLDPHTPGAYLCYCPDAGVLPIEDEQVWLFREPDLKMTGKDILAGPGVLKKVTVLATSPDYKINRILLK